MGHQDCWLICPRLPPIATYSPEQQSLNFFLVAVLDNWRRQAYTRTGGGYRTNGFVPSISQAAGFWRL